MRVREEGGKRCWSSCMYAMIYMNVFRGTSMLSCCMVETYRAKPPGKVSNSLVFVQHSLQLIRVPLDRLYIRAVRGFEGTRPTGSHRLRHPAFSFDDLWVQKIGVGARDEQISPRPFKSDGGLMHTTSRRETKNNSSSRPLPSIRSEDRIREQGWIVLTATSLLAHRFCVRLWLPFARGPSHSSNYAINRLFDISHNWCLTAPPWWCPAMQCPDMQ